MFKFRILSTISLILPLLLILTSCSEDSPTEIIPPDGDETRWEPDGVLLEGDPDSPAMDALIELAPSPAAQDDITDEGLITTRLMAAFDQTATVGQINGSLNRIDARIVAMTRSMAGFSLIIDPVASVAEAEELCSALTDSFGFILAFPAHALPLGLPEESSGAPKTDKADQPVGVSLDLAHLEDSRIPAAWNVRGLVQGHGFPVIIPDQYVSTSPHHDLTNQSFPNSPTSLTTTAKDMGAYVGNHGFHVTGIIGANWDNDDINAGVHPEPSKLNLRSVPISRISWFSRILEIGRNLPFSDQFVLNTSIGFAEKGFTKHSKAERIFLGIMWRRYAHQYRNRSIHATAAGNQGRGQHSKWASPFTVSAHQDDLPSMLGNDPGNLTERAKLDRLWNQVKSSNPGIDTKPENVFVVGSSQASSGTRAASSVVPEDVRMVGEYVSSLCLWPDNECTPPSQIMSGTSMASPQIAGLAAYMWTLDPSLSANTIYDAIEYAFANTWKPGVVDGFALILGMDKSMAEAKIRKELFDVANSQGVEGSNSVFDHHDIALFLAKFQYYQNERASGGTYKDHSRYDLNGDGLTGGDQESSFDLDINQPPRTDTVPQDILGTQRMFDETALNDLAILCYYSYSDLFSGDTGQRDALLQECVANVKLITEFPDVVFPNQPAALTVRAASIANKIQLEPWNAKGYTVKADTTWLEGLDLQLTPIGGGVELSSGITDASGKFSTMATIDQSADQIEIIILANRNGSQVAEATETGANGSVEITILNSNFSTAAGGQAHAVFESVWPDPDSDGSDDFVSNNLSSTITDGVVSGNSSASFSSSGSLIVTITDSPGSATPLIVAFNATANASATQSTESGAARDSGANSRGGGTGEVTIRIDRGKVQLSVIASLAGDIVAGGENRAQVWIPIFGTRSSNGGDSGANTTVTLENGVNYTIRLLVAAVAATPVPAESSNDSHSATGSATFTFKAVR